MTKLDPIPGMGRWLEDLKSGCKHRSSGWCVPCYRLRSAYQYIQELPATPEPTDNYGVADVAKYDKLAVARKVITLLGLLLAFWISSKIETKEAIHG